MITYLFLPFLLFKVVVLNFLTLEHDSATHDVVVVVHVGIIYKSWRCSKAGGEAKAAWRRNSSSLWKA